MQDPPPPFLLASAPAPAFPSDIRVPPHRGASIVATFTGAALAPVPADGTAGEYLVIGAPKRRARKAEGRTDKAAPRRRKTTSGKPAKRAAAERKRAERTPAERKPTAKRPARAKAGPAPATATIISPLAAAPMTPPAATAAAAGAIAGMAIPGTAPAAARPLPRGRALVRTDAGLVGRLVAWLERLVPRKRRAALPRSRTRLAQSAPAPAPLATRASVPQSGHAEAPSADVTQRMLLQLSDENERLRREIAALRTSIGAA